VEALRCFSGKSVEKNKRVGAERCAGVGSRESLWQSREAEKMVVPFLAGGDFRES